MEKVARAAERVRVSVAAARRRRRRYRCVLIQLYMCQGGIYMCQGGIYVSSYCYIFGICVLIMMYMCDICVLILLCMCILHTDMYVIYVSSYCCICVKETKLSKKEHMLLDLLYVCLHTTIYVSSCYYT